MVEMYFALINMAKYDAIANKLTALNVFIGYRVLFCRAASVFACAGP